MSQLPPRAPRKGRPVVTDAAVRGLQALYGPDPLDPAATEPWLSAIDARAILRGLRTVPEAWAHYCMLKAFRLQETVNVYCTASTVSPAWPKPIGVLPAPVTPVTLTSD